MKKTGKWIYIVVCMLLCLLPLVGMSFHMTKTSTENKTLAAFPKWKTDKGINMAYFKDFEKWFDDHFAFRNELVTADAQIQSHVFGVSNMDTVVKGTDGWLYYTDTVRDYLGRDTMNERQVYNTVHNLMLLEQFVENQGASFVFTIAPNKNTLYGTNMPYYLKHRASDVKNVNLLVPQFVDRGLSYADLFTPFEKSTEILYLKRDSHWSNKGAVLAYNTIFDNLELEHDTYETVPAIRKKTYYGDLNKMLYPLLTRPEWNEEYQYMYQFSYTSEEDDVEAAWLTTACEHAPNGNLLMFRDSFGNALLPLMAENFSQAAFSKAVPYRVEEYMKISKPDVVIAEKVERNLDEFMTKPPIMQGIECTKEELLTLASSDKNSGKLSDLKVSASLDDASYHLVEGTLPKKYQTENTDVYVRLQAGEQTRVFEPFTVTMEESDYGYQLYLSADTVTELGIHADSKVILELIVSDGKGYKAAGTCQVEGNAFLQ